MFQLSLGVDVTFGLDLLVKMTILLALAVAIDQLWAGRSAAVRHWLWVACFVALLLLPLAILFAPGMRLNVWPSSWSQVASVPTSAIQDSEIILPTIEVSDDRMAMPLADHDIVAREKVIRPRMAETGQIGTLDQTNRQDISEALNSNPVAMWFFAGWVLGSVISLIPLVRGCWRNRRLRQLSKAVCNSSLLEMFAKSHRQLGIRRTVTLRSLEEEIVPMTWGVIQPVILVSKTAERTWTDDRQQVVLLHELAHVKRLDILWQVVARTTCSVYFFHPLVWYAYRRMRAERELACDDCVLQCGIKSSAYAEQLIQISRELHSMSLPIAAVAMAQRSGLDHRVRSVLNQTISHLPMSRRSALNLAIAFVATSLLLSIPKLCSVAVTQEGTPAVQPSQAAANQAATNQATSGQGTKRPELSPDELTGTVVDEQGKPLDGVLIDAWSWYPGNETKTDASGRFQLKMGDATRKIELRVMKEGYSPFYAAQQSLGVRDFKVILSQRTFVEGVVRDSSGKPVANVEVRGEQGMQQADGVMVGFVATSTKSDSDGRYRLFVHPDTYQLLVRTSSGQTARLTDIVVRQFEAKHLDIDLKPGVRFEAKVVSSVTGKPFSGLVLWHFMHKDVIGKSDASGKLVIDGMLPGDFEFNVGEGEAQQFGPFTGYMPRTLGRWWSAEAKHPHQQEEIKSGQFQRNLDDLNFELTAGMQSVTIFVEPGVTFSGTVTDPDGKPVEGATVAPARTGSGNSLTGDTRYSVKTDREGKYQSIMPAGKGFKYNLIVHDGDYQQWRKWANGVVDSIDTQPGETHQVDLQLTRPAKVRGKVVSKEGREVGGREIRAHAKDLLENRYYDPTVRTNPDGTFELKFVRPGEHWIQVEPFYLSAGEASSGSKVVNLGAGQVLEHVELELPPMAQPVMPATAQREFSIRLLDENGKPVPEFPIILSGFGRQASFAALESPREKLHNRWSTEPIGGDLRKTDADGTIKVQGSEIFKEHAQPVLVWAMDSKGYRGAVGSIAPDGRSADIQLNMQPLREVELLIDDSAIHDIAQSDQEPNVYFGIAFNQVNVMQSQTQKRQMNFHLPVGDYTIFAMHSLSEPAIKPIVIENLKASKPLVESFKMRPNQLAMMIGHPAKPLREIVAWQGGESTSLEALHGKVVLLDFWGYWCGPCLAAMPELIKLHDEFHAHGLEIIAVHDSSQPTLEELNKSLAPSKKNLWNGRDLPFRTALAGNGSTSQPQVNGTAIADYGIREFPTTLLIAPDGKVVGRINPHEGDKNRKLISELLKRP